ncbi:MAG: F0F1 ATP synthase subunit A [Planctomycetota bacterium]|nr:MAG: F0F1 ATP synthase subunit A [Planctomycetota bacterium]
MIDEFLAAGFNPLTHVVDYVWYSAGDGRFTILSNHIIMMLLAAVLLIVFMPRLVRVPKEGDEIDQLTPRGSQNVIEIICQFLRDYVAKPNLGEYTDRFVPYIWSVFFFILTCNVLGLLPLEPITKPIFGHGIYGTATGNTWVTGTLAICTLLMIVVNGLRLNGFAYVKHFFMGPFPLNILIAFLEVVGLVAKTFALALRLFINMCTGHILLAILVSFVGMAAAVGAMVGILVSVPVILGSAAITLLELFVAFLQAFIFTFLSCVFIGQAVVIHHPHKHDDSRRVLREEGETKA